MNCAEYIPLRITAQHLSICCSIHFVEGAYDHKQMHNVLNSILKNLHNRNKDNAANFLFTPLMLSLDFRGVKPRSNSLGLQWTLHPSTMSKLQNIPDAGKYLLTRKDIIFLYVSRTWESACWYKEGINNLALNQVLLEEEPSALCVWGPVEISKPNFALTRIHGSTNKPPVSWVAPC